MDIIRRNTDYGFRAAVALAEHYDLAMPAAKISALEQIPYQLACKILQKLHKAKIVESTMGPKGGFRLSKDPEKISLAQVTQALQGPLCLNRCVLRPNFCSRQPVCGVNRKLISLQQHINDFLAQTSLDNLLEEQPLHKLIYEMKKVFGDDKRRIAHAFSVLDYAERIHLQKGGNPFIIKAAAVLHDIGIPISIKKYGSSGGNYQEIEGPPIAEKILRKYKISSEQINHICKIIANHHSGKNINTTEFKIIWDSDWLVNLPEEFPDAAREKLKKIIDRVFKTETGRDMAVKLFLKA